MACKSTNVIDDFAVLHEHAAGDRTVLELARDRTGLLAELEQADVAPLGLQQLRRRGFERRRHDHLEERALADLAGRPFVERAVDREDAAVRRRGIAGEGAVRGRRGRGADCHAARRGVLDHDGARVLAVEPAELLDDVERGGGVVDVVVAERPAVDLLGVDDGRPGRRRVAVQGRLLVRVLAVAQRVDLGVPEAEHLAERGTGAAREEARDGGVILRGAGVRGRREVRAQRPRRRVVVGVHLGDHLVVPARAGDDGDPLVVLGRGAQHRGAADVHVLDRVGESHIRIGDGAFERIEVDADQVDRVDCRACRGTRSGPRHHARPGGRRGRAGAAS